MDEALKKALDFSNFTSTLNAQKAILKNKCKDDSALYFSGGKFTVTMTLFSFVSSLVLHKIESTILVDDNNTPIQVDNVIEFFELVKNKYGTATNIYLNDYKKLTSKRSIEGLVDE
jgi:hypothetical protein|tara:strand:+ start:47 stop:394 length:348 start_codon:yes stop_codon:yes gene_type:complete